MIVKHSSNKLSIDRFNTFELMSLINEYKINGLQIKNKGRLVPCIKYGKNYILVQDGIVHFIYPYETENRYELYLKDKVNKYFRNKFHAKKEYRLDELNISYDATPCISISFIIYEWIHEKSPLLKMMHEKPLLQIGLDL